MRINSSDYRIGRVSLGRVIGKEGIGIHRILFDIKFENLSLPDKELYDNKHTVEICELDSHVSAKVGKRKTIPIGRGHPREPVHLSVRKNTGSRSRFIAVDLSPAQTLRLEGIRNGGGLQFEIAVYVKVKAERVHLNSDRLICSVSREDWLNVLKDSGYGEYLLFEVPVPPEKSPTALKDAVRHLKKAQKRHLRGEYNDCVAELRKVYESIRDERDESSKIRTANQKYRGSQDSRKAMDASERRLALREAARHVTHIPNHAGGDYYYSRRESRMYLGVAASILSYYLDAFGDEG